MLFRAGAAVTPTKVARELPRALVVERPTVPIVRPAPPAVRGPIALAVVLDTSSAMAGPKLENAKASILRLLARIQDDDEISLVRYGDTSELVLPLTRVSAARADLPGRLAELRPSGGVNVPGALSSGLRTLDDAAIGKTRRLVLVSDGYDDAGAQTTALARRAFHDGITVSTLMVGSDRYVDVDLDHQAF